MKKSLYPLLIAMLLFVSSAKTFAHCEVPCGIYTDELRIALLYEHFTTIEKAMNKISELSLAEDPNYNQMVRWINTKEDHANKVQHIAEQYFLTQRIKIVEESDAVNYSKYQKQLTLLHHIIVLAMKTKQTTDTEHIESLRKTLALFEDLYFEGKHRHKFEEGHK